MRRLLLAQLQRWHYDVTEAEDGKEAWDAFCSGHFQMILTDWVMPNMDGLDLIRRIRESEQAEYVYIVLLTSRSENEDLVEAMEAGADDFLGKPCNPKELRVRLRAGERIIELEQTLIRQNQELKEAQVALIQSEKLAGVGQLAAGMAHEINNPIAFVANNLVVLQRDVQALLDYAEECDRHLDQIGAIDAELAQILRERSTDCDLAWLTENLPHLFQSSRDGLARVREIVSNLRDFAHLDEAETDDMNVAAALTSTIQVLTPEFEGRELRICSQLDDDLIVNCRPAKMKQVFHSILMNAAQASQAGQEIKVSASREDATACIAVRDFGVGIEEAAREHIFEPFYTTRAIGSGKGLGLAVSYGVVQQEGGSIEVESAPGLGSTFRVILPLAQTA